MSIDARVSTQLTYLRFRFDTMPDASAEDVHRIIGAVLDEVALAYVLLSPNVTRMLPAIRNTSSGAGTFSPAAAVLRIRGHILDVKPPYHAVAQVRADVLTLHRISYSNPLEIVVGILGGAAALVAAMAKFIDVVNLMEANRRLTLAQARREDADAERSRAEAAYIEAQTQRLLDRDAIESRTLEITLEEKVILLEKARLDLQLQRIKVAKELDEAQRLSIDMTQILKDARDQTLSEHPEVRTSSLWPDENVEEFMDNNRGIGSIEVAGSLSPDVEVVDEDDAA